MDILGACFGLAMMLELLRLVVILKTDKESRKILIINFFVFQQIPIIKANIDQLECYC